MFSLITADQFVLKGIVHSKLSFQNCKSDFLLGNEQPKQKQKKNISYCLTEKCGLLM